LYTTTQILFKCDCTNRQVIEHRVGIANNKDKKKKEEKKGKKKGL
jgi:hypothetical protein